MVLMLPLLGPGNYNTVICKLELPYLVREEGIYHLLQEATGDPNCIQRISSYIRSSSIFSLVVTTTLDRIDIKFYVELISFFSLLINRQNFVHSTNLLIYLVFLLLLPPTQRVQLISHYNFVHSTNFLISLVFLLL